MRGFTGASRQLQSATCYKTIHRAQYSSNLDNGACNGEIRARSLDTKIAAHASLRSNTTLYKVQPLTKDTCTRVLTIHPSTDKGAPVSFSVEEIDLASKYEPYVAVSHVWGSNPVYDRLTFCADKPRFVTRRVDSLLHRIRNKIAEDDRYKHWSRIWLDTLCIDQADNVLARREKNHQVSIMHRIFGEAQEVVVDLGAADRYSYFLPEAKAEIARLRQRALDDEYCKDILGFPSSVRVEAEEARRVRQALEACSRLLDKQWMCRIWTVQEYALARKRTFLSGSIAIDGDLLTELGKLASHANVKGRSHLSMLFSRFRRALALTKLPQLDAMQDQGPLRSGKLAFGESLALGWHHDCSDERDTIYALRALVDYGGPPLRVDYNEPSKLLSKRVTRKLIEMGDHEAVLAGATGLTKGSENSDAPSWSFLMRPPFKFVGEERHWILSGKPKLFKAGGGNFQVSADQQATLSLGHNDQMEAIISPIGTIAATGEKFPTIPQYGTNPKLPVERLYAYNTERAIHTRAVIIDSWLQHTLPLLNRARKTLKHLDRRSEEVWTTITHGHNGMEFNNKHLISSPTIQNRVDYWTMLVDMSLKGLEDLGYRRRTQSTLSNDIQALEEAMRKRHLLLAELFQRPQEWIDALHYEFDLGGDLQQRGRMNRLLSKTKALSERFANPDTYDGGRGAGADRCLSIHEQLLRKVALNTYMVNEAFDIRKVRAMDQLKMLERRLSVLEDGRLVSVPALAEVGDVLAVFRGISVPYVLRKCGEGQEMFKIVGMGYIRGMMHGEAVDEQTAWSTIRIT